MASAISGSASAKDWVRIGMGEKSAGNSYLTIGGAVVALRNAAVGADCQGSEVRLIFAPKRALRRRPRGAGQDKGRACGIRIEPRQPSRRNPGVSPPFAVQAHRSLE